MSLYSLWISTVCALFVTGSAYACTGITLDAKDGSRIMARTIEWGGNKLDSQYAVFPKNFYFQSKTPSGRKGLSFKTKYGFVGLTVAEKTFTVEGLNEEGLSAGLFFFPEYGSYKPYEEKNRQKTISDMELLSWILGSFKTVSEVKQAIRAVDIVTLYPESGSVHYRVGDKQGNQIVIEIVDQGTVQVFDNPLGVLTNAPGFQWQMTNLNNYVSLFPGYAAPKRLGNVELRQFGAGAGFQGIPGDVTPPSRFVRAAFYQATAPQKDSGGETVLQSFSILNAFDIPIGVEHDAGKAPQDVPSATQWTTSTDLTNGKIYYRTAWNSTIREIDLKNIDFDTIKFQTHPLDEEEKQPIEKITIR